MSECHAMAGRAARPVFLQLLAALALLLSSDAIAQENVSIPVRAERPSLAMPASRALAPLPASESDFHMSVGDQSAGN